MTSVSIQPQTESNMKIYIPALSTFDLPVPPLAKVSGGEVTTPGEFPYHVGLYSHHNAGMTCSGAILSAYLILTAAHCIQGKNPRDFRVIAGEHNRKRREDSEQARLIKEFYMHENFSQNTSSFNFDIALIVLNEPLIFTDKVKHISLPRPNEEFTGTVEIMGFGCPTGLFGAAGAYPNDLPTKSQLLIIPYEECAAKYSRIDKSVTRGMFCAGSTGEDSCRMDSGGLTFCKRTNEKESILCGIGSWGEGGRSAGFPGVNTKVSWYIDWIQNVDKVLANRRKCRTHELFCSGGCIPREKICDGNIDCYGGLDEIGCHNWNIIQCEPDQLRCDNGKCVKRWLFCNNDNDCEDNSDELKCPTPDWTCKETEFKCGHGHSGKCRHGQSGKCIPQEWKCDGRYDCDDLSDENESCSYLNSTAFQSQSATTTVNPTEADTTLVGSCPPNEFSCPHPLRPDFCAPLRWRCDGDIDCLGGTDEADCSSTPALETEGSCPSHKFYCPHSSLPDNCAFRSWLCDGQRDCQDGRDEANCSSVSTAAAPRVPADQQFSTTPCGEEQFFCPLDYPSLTSGEISFRRSCIPLSFRCDGTKHCIGGYDEQDCNNEVHVDSPMTTSTPIQCASEEFMCADGSRCFPIFYKCDGDRDCSDGSDESSCSTAVVSNTVPVKNVSSGDVLMSSTPCPADKFECPILGTLRACVPLSWKCDGHSDCPVGVDELHCPSVSTTPETIQENQVVLNKETSKQGRDNNGPIGYLFSHLER